MPKRNKNKEVCIPRGPNTEQSVHEEYLNIGEDNAPEWVTVAEFIRKAREVHGNAYDYSLVRGRRWEDIPGH